MELPLDFFYYHCPDSISEAGEILGESDPNGLADYIHLIRWKSGIRKRREIPGPAVSGISAR